MTNALLIMARVLAATTDTAARPLVLPTDWRITPPCLSLQDLYPRPISDQTAFAAAKTTLLLDVWDTDGIEALHAAEQLADHIEALPATATPDGRLLAATITALPRVVSTAPPGQEAPADSSLIRVAIETEVTYGR